MPTSKTRRSERVSPISNTAYPILARYLRTRRDNLLATITMLESQLAEMGMAA
jgi:hypothetical protein